MSKMENNTIIIGSSNEGKIKQFTKLLNELNIQVLSASLKIEENGETVEENACIKAIGYKEKFPNFTILTDDAAIEFDALNGKPGLECRRWMGKFEDNVDDETWLNHVISELKNSKGPLTGSIHACFALFSDKLYTKHIYLPFEITLEPNRPYPKGWPLSALQICPRTKKPLHTQSIDERCNEIREIFHNFVRKNLKISSQFGNIYGV